MYNCMLFRTDFENIRKDMMCYNEIIALMCSNHSRLSSKRNEWGLCDRLKRKKVFTLTKLL